MDDKERGPVTYKGKLVTWDEYEEIIEAEQSSYEFLTTKDIIFEIVIPCLIRIVPMVAIIYLIFFYLF